MTKKGLIYIFEGDGKGKTSAALGVALRMLLNDKKVVWISWFKSLSWQISEASLTKFFVSNLEMFFAGEGFFLKSGEKTARTGRATVYDLTSQEVHKVAAEKALSYVEDRLGGENPPELIVMDEVIRAISDGLLSEVEVLRIVEKRRKTHLVLTGHAASKAMIEQADLVTMMKKIKHPYDKGILAVKGLDY